MDLAGINQILASDSPSEMRLLEATEYARRLTLCFLWNGGPREDHELLVTFEEAAVFHLPRVLFIDTLRLKRCTTDRIGKLIPPVSYDASEHMSDDGYKVIEFTDSQGAPMGYYVMALELSGDWKRVPRDAV